MTSYSAIIQRDGKWWIGWIEEIPGVNSQGATRRELMRNLRSALGEALEMNRADARAAARGEFEEESVVPHAAGVRRRNNGRPRTVLRKPR